nr:hypothetical protein [Tanacetum cinerariifolium]
MGWDLFEKVPRAEMTLHAYFAAEGIQHQTSVARTPKQNGIVERRNRTLVEAARTMLSAAKVPLFFWAEAIATACFTQNRSLIVRDGENLDKMKEKGDECIFVGTDPGPSRHSMASVQNSTDPAPTCQAKASVQISSDPTPKCQTMVLEHGSLSPGHKTVTMSNELDLLFSLMFDELLNGSSKVVSKSSAVCSADAPNQRQQLIASLNNHTTPAPICQVPTLEPTVSSSENINQTETYAENDQVADDECRHVMLIHQICTLSINDIPLNIVGQKIVH